jgi:hypothetical protein
MAHESNFPPGPTAAAVGSGRAAAAMAARGQTGNGPHNERQDPARRPPRRAARLPDRCDSCGRFVGFYPVGFVCDTHCASCSCPSCPLPF